MSRRGAGHPDRTQALARTQALSRSAATARSGAAPGASQLALLRCQAGPYPLLLDVRALVSVDRPADRPVETGLRLIDLRALLGAPTGPGQSLVFVLRAGEDPVEVMVDPGVELLHLDPHALHPWPWPLEGLPALRGLSGLVELEDGLVLLVDPHRLL